MTIDQYLIWIDELGLRPVQPQCEWNIIKVGRRKISIPKEFKLI